MIFSSYLLGTIVLVLWLYFLWSRRKFYKVAYELGGPLGLPFVGLGLKLSNENIFVQEVGKMIQEYQSPLITWMGTYCMLIANDPETIETILTSNACNSKAFVYSFLTRAIGEGLVTLNSPEWNRHRKLINPAFSRPVVLSFISIFNNEGNVLLEKISEEMKKDKKVDIFEKIKRTVLEVSCQTTMGTKMNFQNDKSAPILDAFKRLPAIVLSRMITPMHYLDVMYKFSAKYLASKKHVGNIYNFTESLLQYGDATKASKKLGSYTESTDNMDEFADEKEKLIFVDQLRKHVGTGQFTYKDIRDEAVTTVVAAFETTSTAMYISCLCLAMHPECQNKVYNELHEIFQNEDEVMNLKHEHLDRMKYTEMVINESMRLFSPVPAVLRRFDDDLVLKNGVTVPRGTQAIIDIFDLHRNEKVWGPQAKTFQPELHFGAGIPHPFSFMPFMKGPRTCIGNRYAMIVLKAMVAKIIWTYKLHTDVKVDDLSIKGAITIVLRNCPLVEVTKR